MKALLAAMLLLLAPAGAQSGSFQPMGASGISCGTWIAARRDGKALTWTAEQWVLGFLSGIGFVGLNGADPLQGMDSEGVWAWIDNYCRAHPIDEVLWAAAAFYQAYPH